MCLTGASEAGQYHYLDLGTFTGLQTDQSQPAGEALGLNDQGQIVGWAWIWNAKLPGNNMRFVGITDPDFSRPGGGE